MVFVVTEKIEIRLDDLRSVEIDHFLKEHIEEMKSVSPPESKHALDLKGLRKPEITFWTVWDGDRIVGCGAIKELSSEHAEIKSMRTNVAESLFYKKAILKMMDYHVYFHRFAH